MGYAQETVSAGHKESEEREGNTDEVGGREGEKFREGETEPERDRRRDRQREMERQTEREIAGGGRRGETEPESEGQRDRQREIERARARKRGTKRIGRGRDGEWEGVE